MIVRNSVPSVIIGVFLAILFAGTAPAGTRGVIDCDIQNGPCVKMTASGMQVEFDVAPRPVMAMRELAFYVTLRKQGKPVSGAHLILDLSMPDMFMGNNQPKLKEEQNGRYRGSGVIPLCVTGRKTWKAFIAVAQGGRVEKVSFLFEVQ